jgi:hypothetical protein
MEELLLRDSDGVFVLKEEAAKALEKDPKAMPTIFSYEVEPDEDVFKSHLEAEQNYYTKMMDLMKSESGVVFKSINAKTKIVKTDDGKNPLIEVISDYFGSGEISFLESTGILTNLD